MNTFAGAAALLDPDLRPAAGHVVADRGIRHPARLVLIQQPGMDPRRRVPLLARSVQVRPQPPVDHRLERLQPGRPPLRRLARGRLSPGQRLPHQPPVHPVLARQRPHRQAPVPRITPDQLEQLDLGGHHSSLLRPARTLTLPRQPPRWGHFKPTRPSRHQPPPRSGATSSRHGGANSSRPSHCVRRTRRKLPPRYGETPRLNPGRLRRVTLAAHASTLLAPVLAVHGRGRQARRAEGAPLKPWRKL